MENLEQFNNKEISMETTLKQRKVYSYDRTYSWEQIQLANADHLVLVNVNRIYWKFSDLLQKLQHEKCSILESVMMDIKDERLRYMPMRVEDILKCFSDDGAILPKCTFVEYEQE